ncbi:MAG: MtsA protein [Myxococcota bacterium]|nr:MtsA protein [Myxococcota bacterium]
MICLIAVLTAVGAWWFSRPPPAPVASAHLSRVGPTRASNQTSQPLALYGSGFLPGMQLKVGAPVSRTLPVTVVDPGHAYARLPAVDLPPGQVEAKVLVSLISVVGKPVPGQPQLTLINDAAFPDPQALILSRDGRFAFVASPSTDTVHVVELTSGRVGALPAGDGPIALDTLEADGQWVVAAHAYAPLLRLWRTDGAHGEALFSGAPTTRDAPTPTPARALRVTSDGTAYLAEHARDTVVTVALRGEGASRTFAVEPNPGPLALEGDRLWVGSLQGGTVERLEPESGRRVVLAPGPGASIVGGRTDGFESVVMGGKAPRAFAWSGKLGALFVSGIGPNIGPNPERMEVSMNGGVSVYTGGAAPRFARHLGFGAGITEGLALDDGRGLLYAADIGVGQVRVIDAALLLRGDEDAARAQLQQLAILPPEDFPRFRAEADFGTAGRAGVEVHSGPRALALSADGRTLYVLARFTGRLAVVDVSTRGQARVVRQLEVVDTLGQPKRRLGQVLYYADLGRTAMSCDACHLEGHTEGVFFEKTRPLRIYRSPTVRGSHDTPPFFIPESTRSLAETAQDVGTRNRFGNPSLTPREIEALALFSGGITLQPNPFVGPDGAPPETLHTEGERTGSPRRGQGLFEGKGGCVGCHPPPLFTTDQDPGTRGRFLDVGTPVMLPLREALQDGTNQGFPPPALAGSWDVFPMLTSGAAGLEVKDGVLLRSEISPLRRMVTDDFGGKHGAVGSFTDQEREDLLAYLMTL